MHREGGGGPRGMGPPKISKKLLNKNSIKFKKIYNPMDPHLKNLAKPSWTLPLDFQPACVYDPVAHFVNRLISIRNSKNVN
jgi:hypothetical protein